MVDKSDDQLKKIQCSELEKLKKMYPDFNFDAEIAAKPDLADFLRMAI